MLSLRRGKRAALFCETDDMGTLRLDRVGKDYLTEGIPVPALHDVSLEFRAGEFVALVGRSGCGKSTLLNLAGVMDFPTSGARLAGWREYFPRSQRCGFNARASR